MTIIASLLFTAAFILSGMAITIGLSGAMPRIKQIFGEVHGNEQAQPMRKITISMPVSTSAEIIPMVRKKAPVGIATIHSEGIAA